jgi:hypothetical protein
MVADGCDQQPVSLPYCAPPFYRRANPLPTLVDAGPAEGVVTRPFLTAGHAALDREKSTGRVRHDQAAILTHLSLRRG